MIINIYMFNDHLLFSNNINDAANQLRNIQLQQLEEEKYKKLSIQLQEQVNELETFINLIESGQYLSEADLRSRLAALFRREADDVGSAAAQTAARAMAKPRTFVRSSLPNWVQTMLGDKIPTFWKGRLWVVDEASGKIYRQTSSGEWVEVVQGETPWGKFDDNGTLNTTNGKRPANGKPFNTSPGNNEEWVGLAGQFIGRTGVVGVIGGGALATEIDDWDTGSNGPGGPVGP